MREPQPLLQPKDMLRMAEFHHMRSIRRSAHGDWPDQGNPYEYLKNDYHSTASAFDNCSANSAPA